MCASEVGYYTLFLYGYIYVYVFIFFYYIRQALFFFFRFRIIPYLQLKVLFDNYILMLCDKTILLTLLTFFRNDRYFHPPEFFLPFSLFSSPCLSPTLWLSSSLNGLFKGRITPLPLKIHQFFSINERHLGSHCLGYTIALYIS